MTQIVCPACGSNELSNEEIIQSFTPPFGQPVEFRLVIQRCHDCEEGGDFAGDNSAIVKGIVDEANRASAAHILNSLADRGISMAFFERALQLPKRTLARWKAGDVSAAGIALLRIIRTYPWVLGVAAKGFSRAAADEALKVVTEVADTSIVCQQKSSMVEYVAGGEVVDLKSYANQKATVNRSHAETVPCVVAGGM